MKVKKILLFVAMWIGVFGIVGADDANKATVKLDADHSSRTAEEKARDVNRLPEQTLAFFGVESDMRVIELFPGGGWYTKLLGPYLQSQGQLYIAMGTDRIAGKLNALGLDNVAVTGDVENFKKTDSPGFIFSIDAIDLQQRNVDRVLTFRNAHNLTTDARMLLNKAVFDALKPGGVYGVIDHSRRHMAPFNPDSWRRIDAVQIIKEAVAVGFVFEDYSTIHARTEDDLQHETRHESLVNESDRFTLKFVKPK